MATITIKIPPISHFENMPRSSSRFIERSTLPVKPLKTKKAPAVSIRIPRTIHIVLGIIFRVKQRL